MDNKSGIERYEYDLSNHVATVGKIGRLQTCFVRELVGGTTFECSYNLNVRLSALVRPMYSDAQVDLFAFFVPHRHVYGADWRTFILTGYDEGVSLTTRTLSAGRNECLGQHYNSGDTIPLWAPQGYINIFNRYFKLPGDTDVAANVFDALNHATDDRMDYGFQCGWLPRNWNTIILSEVTTADKRVALSDTNTTLDLTDFADMQGRLQTELVREWYAPGSGARYTDIMRNTYGADVNTDADQRPELLAHTSELLSGFDINATDSVGLGTVGGKSVGQFNLTVRPKFFAEHGVVWVMMLVRFLPIHAKETSWLGQKSNPTYAEISGDPEIYKRKGPVTNNISEWIKDSTLTSAGIIPYGQWYREAPARVHQRYIELTGHPYATTVFSDIEHVKYIHSGQYDAVFNDLQAGHWNSQGWASCYVKSPVPPPMVGVFAGTN